MIPRMCGEDAFLTSRRSLLNRFIGGLTAWTAAGRIGPVLPACADPTTDPPDGLSEAEPREVAAVIDGDTVALRGGDTLRLIGIEAPKRVLAPNDSGLAALEAQAAATLHRLIGGSTLHLRYDTLRRDRYGRILAHGFAADGTWLSAALVSAGAARVHGDGTNRRGLRSLLGLEQAARALRLALWQHPAFAVRLADDPALGRLVGRFEIVEGKVAATAVMEDRGFINFGPDRHTDLTLVLKKPALSLMQVAMIDLSRLAGRRVRCRGWLDLHDGPSMEVSHPEQIEVLEDPIP